MNIAIVVSDFNYNITSKMLKIALEKTKRMKITVTHTCKVHGVFDMPIIVEALLNKNDVDAVVTLGAIIKGQTKHDEVIAYTVLHSLSQLSLKYKKPVSLGISGPGMHERIAYSRIRRMPENAIDAVSKSLLELAKLK